VSDPAPEPLAGLIGASAAIVAVRAQIARLLQQASGGRRLPPILIRGETGTGKGLVARAIHAGGPRATGPFTDVNCAAIPDTLLESEMFGYERGAFTGAGTAKPGLFQAANQGTIFLDEIGLLPEPLQSKLLKVVEERQVRRLGGTRNDPIDVAVVAATSEDLETAIQARRFRADLYHRLAVVTIQLPPLRDRGEDVLLLAEHFLDRACADYHLPPRILGDDARGALVAYAWPGNVRELANVVERASLFSDTRVVPAGALGLKETSDAQARDQDTRPRAHALRDVLERTERERLVEALDRSGWNLSRAAGELGIPRNTLRYRMERMQLRPPPPSRRPARGRPAAARTSAAPPAAPAREVAVPETATPTRPAVAWQRRRLAFLGVGVDTGTPGGWSADAVRVLDLVVEKIVAFGGHVEEMATTGVVASFGREAVEDAARRAALAARAIQTSTARDAPPGRAPASVRLAIHVEECEVAQIGDAIGIDAASRQRAWSTVEALRPLATPDSIVASAAAAESLRRRFDAVVIGTRRDGGATYQLAGAERILFAADGGVSRFVGRRRELDWLRGRLTAALAGDGQVVCVVGEAGIGKSRLVFELCHGLSPSAAVYAEGRCVSYGSATPYLPIAAVIRQLCGLLDSDPPAAVESKLQSCLGTTADDAQGRLYILNLLGVQVDLGGMTPETVRTRTFDAVVKLMPALAERRPLVILIEDLHWIDGASDELLGAFVQSVAGRPVLLLTTSRPGSRATWVDRSHVSQLALPPLSPEDSMALVRATPASSSVSDSAADTILARGQGNPFFLEELARAVAERPEGTDAFDVPATVHDVLAARIGRLAAAERALLQAASVIGRDVTLDVLVSISDDPEASIVSRLRRLVAAEFLTVAPVDTGGRYRFKHALTHEVAYRSLLDGPRRDLHARTVEALERAGLDQSAEDLERLARHALNAELWEKAVSYFRKAAAAVSRSAASEAVALLELALGALSHVPETTERAQRELGLHMALGVSVIATEGYGAPRVERAYARARELCGQVGQTPRLLGALLGLWAFHLFRGELQIARTLADQCLAVVERFPESPMLAWARLSVGVTAFWLGDASSARVELERVLAAYDPDEHGPQAVFYGQDFGVTCLGYLGWVWWVLGEPARAEDAAARAIALADRLSHPFSRAGALALGAGTSLMRREAALARARADAAVTIATEYGFPIWAAMGTFYRGWAMSEEGLPQGIDEMRRGLAAWRGHGSTLSAPWFLAVLAGALLGRGDADEALRTVDEALDVATHSDERWYGAEIHRMRGVALAQLGGTHDAEAALRHAMTQARKQGVPLLELRAATSLARLGADDAWEPLARLGTQLAGAGDTPDLVEARAALATYRRQDG
jgi:DNA-binding NtrC family response regulator/predicted ATPase